MARSLEVLQGCREDRRIDSSSNGEVEVEVEVEVAGEVEGSGVASAPSAVRPSGRGA